ncbi:MAG: M28 family metallopeptidase [Chloroflexota bacterium]|nr:M28 family metallopeptidase [Chloroflexota bacterium]
MVSRDPDHALQSGPDEEARGSRSARRGDFARLGILRSVLGISGALILGLIAVAALLNVFDDDISNAPSSDSTAGIALETQAPEGQGTGESPAQTAPSATETLPVTDRSEDGATPAAGAPSVATEQVPVTEAAWTSIASSCPERCLVRVPADDDPADMLAAAGTRASWTGESWTWTVATPNGITALEADGEAPLVTKSAETLRLYVVVMPDGEDDDSLVEQFGTVLDSVDRYRLVEVETVPAVVTSLTDSGYLVEKILPAPPTEIVSPEESVALADIDIGSLMEEVSSDNLERSILELQATSSTDDSGVGTRYYAATGNAMAAEYLVQRLESYGMRVWYEDFLMADGHLLVNVVGEIAGRDPGAIYGVLSHYDTLSTDLSDSPGADDNATGIAASLEIARILSGYELENPVRIIFVSAEEVGIVGADQFARRAVSEGTPYEGVFNVDAVGSDRQGTLMVLNTNSAGIPLEDVIVRINDSYGLGQEMMVRQNPAIVADDNKLRDQGLDAVLVSRELYGWNTLHHTPDDLIDYVSIPNTASATVLILLSVGSLVQG